jgi:hypothetical protein
MTTPPDFPSRLERSISTDTDSPESIKNASSPHADLLRLACSYFAKATEPPASLQLFARYFSNFSEELKREDPALQQLILSVKKIADGQWDLQVLQDLRNAAEPIQKQLGIKPPGTPPADRRSPWSHTESRMRTGAGSSP